MLSSNLFNESRVSFKRKPKSIVDLILGMRSRNKGQQNTIPNNYMLEDNLVGMDLSVVSRFVKVLANELLYKLSLELCRIG